MEARASSHRLRTAVVAAACSALLAGGGAAPAIASAVESQAAPTAVVTFTDVAKKEFITIHVNAKTVKHGGTVTLSGKVFHIRDGSRLTVEHKKGNHWTTLKHTTVKHGKYSVNVKLTKKGTEHLRVSHGKTHSHVVTVRVR